MKQKCKPFEVQGAWLSRLSMWHLGTADTMFAVESTPYIVWEPEDCTHVLVPERDFEDNEDSEWSIRDTEDDVTVSDSADSDFDDPLEDGFESDDVEWCTTSSKLQTWEIVVDLCSKVSKRQKYQLMPLVL
jgi:hypothetical protein